MKSLARSETNFTEGPLLKNILLFTIPLMLNGILQLLFNAADIIVVGKFAGSGELAAVGATSSSVNLIVNFCIGLSIGSNVLIARHIGAKDTYRVEKAVHTAIATSILFGIITGVVGFLISGPLLRLLDTPSDIFNSALKYMRAYFVGVPATIVYNFGASILRSKGDTERPLRFLTVAGIVNVILNLIFVIVFHMGALGVGLATAISQFVSMTLVILCLITEQSEVHLDISKIAFDKNEMSEIVAIGLPAGLQSSMFSISNMMVQASVNSFDQTAIVAGSAAAGNVEGFAYVAINSFAQTMLTLSGQNLGAGKLKRVDAGLKACALCAAVTGILFTVTIMPFAAKVLSIYSNDAEVIRYGINRLWFVMAPYCLCGIMESLGNGVRGLGYSLLPLFVAIFGTCIFRITWLAFVFPLMPTINNIFIVYPISWFLTGAAHFVCYIFARKRLNKIKKADIIE